MPTPMPRPAILVIATTILAIAVGPAPFASAEEDRDVREIVAQIEDALSDRATSTSKDGLVFGGTEGSAVLLPADTGGEVKLTGAGGQRISFAFPHASTKGAREASKGLSIYDNADGTLTVPIVKTGGSVQVVSIIEDPTAPTRLDFIFDLPDGASISVTGGSAVITDSEGKWLAGVLPPLAVDADNNAVSTRLEVRGRVVTQVVDHLTAEPEYPVTASATAASQLISKVTRIADWNNQARYSVYRTAAGKNLAGAPAQTILQTYGWPQAVALAPSGFNTTSIHQQFDCHTVFARAKDPWNLEKGRPQNPNWPINPQECNWT